MRRKPPIRF